MGAPTWRLPISATSRRLVCWGGAAATATVLALLAALGTPGQLALAAGATITISSGSLTYAGTSASSNLTVNELTPTSYRFSDPNEGSINFPAGCATVGGVAYT